MILEQTGELAPMDKPWQLIRDALHDLALQERMPGYVVDMGQWHYRGKWGVRQGLAGAVMSRRLDVPYNADVDPFNFGFENDDTRRLVAINYFHCGGIVDACTILDLNVEGLQQFWPVAPYERDPKQFKQDLLDLADYLEEHYKGSLKCSRAPCSVTAMKLEQTGPLAPIDKPWQLVRDAIHDLTLQEQTPGYVIDMGQWHRPASCGTCYQCLAGAVMSRRLGVNSCEAAHPNQFDLEDKLRLLALNKFREGEVRNGVGVWTLGMHYLYTDRVENRSITPYSADPEQFKAELLDLADFLERQYKLHQFVNAKYI